MCSRASDGGCRQHKCGRCAFRCGLWILPSSDAYHSTVRAAMVPGLRQRSNHVDVVDPRTVRGPPRKKKQRRSITRDADLGDFVRRVASDGACYRVKPCSLRSVSTAPSADPAQVKIDRRGARKRRDAECRGSRGGDAVDGIGGAVTSFSDGA